MTDLLSCPRFCGLTDSCLRLCGLRGGGLGSGDLTSVLLESTATEQDPTRPTFFSELLAVLVFFAFSAGFLIAATFFSATVFFSGATSFTFFGAAAGAVFVLDAGFLAAGALAFVFVLVAGAATALAFAVFFSTGFFGALGFLAGPSDSSLELVGLLF